MNFMRVPQAQVSLRIAEAIGETNSTQVSWETQQHWSRCKATNNIDDAVLNLLRGHMNVTTAEIPFQPPNVESHFRRYGGKIKIFSKTYRWDD